MPGKNIYFAGPDATRKTTLALRLGEYLRGEKGLPVKVFNFPSPISFATSAIYAYRQERAKIGPHALTMAYALDRIDFAESKLVPIRTKNPETLFVFDRGSLDGYIYASARTPEGFEPDEYVRWAANLDYIFDKLFPCDLGFLLSATQESSTKIIGEREGILQADIFDKNKSWQTISRKLFADAELTPEWHRINLINPAKSIEREFDQIREMVDRVLLDEEGRILRDRQV